jgi:hypothetical protein
MTAQRTDAYGPLPDYHACFPRPDGCCRRSGEEKRYRTGRGMPACGDCLGLAQLPVPGVTACCPVCKTSWSRDPETGMAYCAWCEAMAGRRATATIAKRKARRAAGRLFEARQRAWLAEQVGEQGQEESAAGAEGGPAGRVRDAWLDDGREEGF